MFNHDGMKAQTDEELVEGPSRVSLLCPISHKRITSPVKGVSCKHHQCFDYNTFMEINSRRPSWRCPYCNRNVSFPDLRLDLRMLKILKECEDTAMDVMVSEDGSWKMLSSEETQTLNDSKKGGSSPNHSGDTSAEEGEIRGESINPNCIELSDTEDEERQNQENACNSFAVVSLDGSSGGGDRVLEDRKPDIREINLAVGAASALGGQTEPARDGGLFAPAFAEVPQSASFPLQPPAIEGGFTISEGIAERQVNREITRSPMAIQALPAQAGTSNSNVRTWPRTSSQPNSPAHSSGGIHPAASNSQLGTNQRPLQVQLPSFVGIQDGQVLLNTGQNQQLQLEVPELQNVEFRDFRQRVAQHVHQQRTTSTQPSASQPVGQPSPRVSREHPYYPPPWQQVRQVQPTQQQATQLQSQGHLNIASNIAREEFVSPGLPSIAEGIPMFNQSTGGLGVVANALRRPTPQTTRTQYIQTLNNPLIVSNANVPARDQRRPSFDGIPGLVDPLNLHPSEQMQRRMRGSISSPAGRDTSMIASVPLSTTLQWMHGGPSQPYRFSPGVSLPGWSGDAIRYTDASRSSTASAMNIQSIQTASTLVSDFDNWYVTTQNDPFLAHHGLGDFGDMRHG